MAEKSPQPRLSRSARRLELLSLLEQHNPGKLRLWAETSRNPLPALSPLLFNPAELLRWRAIEAVGIAAAVEAERSLETVRELLRHNFWMMNDESGNVGWFAPETIGEVLYSVPGLIDEYAGRLPAFFVEEPFERGAYWAVMRVASRQPGIFADFTDELIESTEYTDPVIRCRALRAMGSIDPIQAQARAKHMIGDVSVVREYNHTDGTLEEVVIGRVAETLLAR